MAEKYIPQEWEVFGTRKSDELKSKEGYTHLRGDRGNDKYIIENLANSWAEIDDKGYYDEPEHGGGKADANDQIIIKNQTSNDVMLFFDVVAEGSKNDDGSELEPEYDLYVVQKDKMEDVYTQMSSYSDAWNEAKDKYGEEVADETVNPKDYLTGGAIDIMDYFGNSPEMFKDGKYGKKGGNYINTIQTVDKNGVTETLDVQTYIKEVRAEVQDFLTKHNASSAIDLLFFGENDTLKDELFNIYKKHSFNVTAKGTEGDDLIESGEGNDKIYGEEGKNTLIFNSGAGNDTVYSGKGEDTIKFADAKGFDDLKLVIKGNDLVINHGDDDSVTIANYLKSNGKSSVKYIQIGDSERELLWGNDNIQIELNADEIAKKNKVTGSIMNDLITAESGDNYTIKGGAGNDTIIGGAGNDKLYGDSGKNTLIFNSGDGNDTVYSGKFGDEDTLVFNGSNARTFSANTESFDDLKFTVKGKDLVINHGENDSVTIANYLKSNGKSSVKYIQIGDSERELLWGNDKIHTELTATNPNKGAKITGSILNDQITGTSYNDVIKGGAGNDTIIGGGGSDKLYGDAGNNTFVFEYDYEKGKGFGEDIVYNSNSKKVTANDTLVFADAKNEDFSFEDLSFFKSGNDLKITYDYTKSMDNAGSVTVKDYFKVKDHSVQNVQIGETTKSIAELTSSDLYTAGSGKIKGTSGDDIIFGSDKNDIITTYDGNDTIYTGKGNDTIILNITKPPKNWEYSGDDSWTMIDNKKVITSAGGMNTIKLSIWDLPYDEPEISYNKTDKTMRIADWFSKNEIIINNFNNDYTLVDSKNHKISLLAGEDNITGTKGSDYIYSTGNNKTVTTNGGKDTVYLWGYNSTINFNGGNAEIVQWDENGESFSSIKNSDDTYNINKFDSKTSVAIVGDNGGNDTLNINAAAKNLRLAFEVSKEGGADLSTLYIFNKGSLNYKNIVKDSWLVSGAIEIECGDAADSTIETINAKGQKLNIDNWVNKITQDVQGWLADNGYSCTGDIDAENDKAAIKELLAIYQQHNGADYLM